MALVQSVSGTASASSSLTLTFGSAVTAGNCVVACIGVYSNSSGTFTVSTVKSGSSADNWALGVSDASAGSGNNDSEIWVDSGAAGGNTTVVITASGTATEITAWAMEFSAILASSAVDKTSEAITASNSWSSGATATLSQASEVAVGMNATFFGGSLTLTGPGSPWNELGQISQSSQAYQVTGWQSVNATTALTYAGTGNTGSASSVCLILTLKAETLVTDTEVSVAADASTKTAPQGTDSSAAADASGNPVVQAADSSPASDAGETVRPSAQGDAALGQESNGKVVNAIDHENPVAADVTGTVIAYPSDTDASAAADSPGSPGPRSADAALGTDSASQVTLHDTEGEITLFTARIGPVSADVSQAAEQASPGPQTTDAALGTDAAGHLSPHDLETPQASDGGELINGHRLIFDTEPVRGTDSGFSQVSDSDSCSLSDSGTPAVRTALQQDSSLVTDLERRSWPHDSENSYAADQELRSWPRDTELSAASDVQQAYGPRVTDASTAADQAPVVFIYSYQPAFRWTGGGFEVVLAHPRYGERVFWRGPSVTRQALELASGFWAADFDDCRSASDEDTAMEVTVAARPAARVMAAARRAMMEGAAR